MAGDGSGLQEVVRGAPWGGSLRGTDPSVLCPLCEDMGEVSYLQGRTLTLYFQPPHLGYITVCCLYVVAAARAGEGRFTVWPPGRGPGLCWLTVLLPPSKQSSYCQGREEGKRGTVPD